MKQDLSPAIIAAGIGGIVIIVGIVGFFIFSGRQSTNSAPIIPSGPPPPAPAQIVGPGAAITPGLGAPPPGPGQIVGPGSQH